MVTDPEARGLLDDAAVLRGPHDLVLTHDMLVEGVHFLSADPPEDEEAGDDRAPVPDGARGGPPRRPQVKFLKIDQLSPERVSITGLLHVPVGGAATAVELVHEGTLYHDDIVDGAIVRRGQRTAVAAHGARAAAAAGGVLLYRGMEMVLDLPAPVRIAMAQTAATMARAAPKTSSRVRKTFTSKSARSTPSNNHSNTLFILS